MGKDTTSLREILQFAITKERVARALYADAAREAESASARQTLVDLAEAEGRHERALQGLDVTNLPDVTPAGARDLRIVDFLEDVELDADSDFQAVLIYAAKREQKARDFYEAMADSFGDPEAKKLFHLLAAQEQGHKRLLETIYDDQFLAED